MYLRNKAHRWVGPKVVGGRGAQWVGLRPWLHPVLRWLTLSCGPSVFSRRWPGGWGRRGWPQGPNPRGCWGSAPAPSLCCPADGAIEQKKGYHLLHRLKWVTFFFKDPAVPASILPALSPGGGGTGPSARWSHGSACPPWTHSDATQCGGRGLWPACSQPAG